MKPTFSIIMTSFNYAPYVGAAIESVLAQTYADWELLIVDDCSTDNSWDIIRGFHDPRIKAHRHEVNLGACAAYNHALPGAKGRYIACLDSDDVFLPVKLERQASFLAAHLDVDVCGTFATEIDCSGAAILRETPHADWFNVSVDLNNPATWLWQNRLCHSGTVVRAEMHSRLGEFDHRLVYTPDWQFWIRALVGGARFAVIDEPLVGYRNHGGNITHKNRQATVREHADTSARNLLPWFQHLGRQDLIEATVQEFVVNQEIVLADDLQADVAQGLFSGSVAIKTGTALLRIASRRQAELKASAVQLADVLKRKDELELGWRNAQAALVEIASLNHAVSERDGQIASLNHAVSERDGQIASLNHAVSERDRQIVSLNHAVSERDGQTASLNHAVSERDGQIASLNHAVSERNNQIANLNQCVIDSRRELEHVLTSKSWRFTKPLRYIRQNFANKPQLSFRRTMSVRLRTMWHRLPLSPQRKQNLKETFFSSRSRLSGWGNAYRNWRNSYADGKPAKRKSKRKGSFESGRRILLITHEFSRTGAPRAVLYLANAIYEHFRIRPEIISLVDGPIRTEFDSNGFKTAVTPWLLHDLDDGSEEAQYMAGFGIVIVTSISSYCIVRNVLEYSNELVWWVHEDAAGFQHIRQLAPDLTTLFARCDHVWLGSPVCSQPVLEFVKRDKVHLLLYGCEDVALPNRRHESGRMVFTLVGSVEPRKGQDIYLSAIERLPDDLRHNALFRIIGSPYSEWTEIFYKDIVARADKIAEVECLPNMPFDRLLGFYAETDVMVSASRADPMPIAITQGLMFSKPCLCSSAIGQAQLLEDGSNVLIFENASAQALADRMAWLLKHPGALSAIGESGRDAYEKLFLMSVFIKNVARLMPTRFQVPSADIAA